MFNRSKNYGLQKPKVYIGNNKFIAAFTINGEPHLKEYDNLESAKQFARSMYRSELLRFGHVVSPNVIDTIPITIESLTDNHSIHSIVRPKG